MKIAGSIDCAAPGTCADPLAADAHISGFTPGRLGMRMLDLHKPSWTKNGWLVVRLGVVVPMSYPAAVKCYGISCGVGM